MAIRSNRSSRVLPSIFEGTSASDKRAAGFARDLSGLIDKQIGFGSPSVNEPSVQRPFAGQLDNPVNKDSIVSQLLGQIQGFSQGTNIGGDRGSVEQAILPQLDSFRNTQIGNLNRGEQVFGGTQLGERGQNIQSLLAQQGLDLSNFNSLVRALNLNIENASPVITGGQQSSIGGSSAGEDLQGLISLAGLFASCSFDFKEKLGDSPDVLDKVNTLNIEEWKYKPAFDDKGIKHIGPYAEEWAERFGGSSRTIPYIDLVGVALRSIQELSAKVELLEVRLREKEVKSATKG